MKKGLVHVYHGDGKGKTTCGMGLCIRAVGAGLKVLVFQFLKNSDTSELKVLSQIENITVEKGPKNVKFVFTMSQEEKEEARLYYSEAFERITKKAVDGKYDVLFLDELLHAINSHIVDEEKLTGFLEARPKGLEVIITGDCPSERILNYADYISHISKQKHPYDVGIRERIGIEK